MSNEDVVRGFYTVPGRTRPRPTIDKGLASRRTRLKSSRPQTAQLKSKSNMSDLISTPSQTQSPVSSEAFEALIDLLTSDGIDETPSRLAENRPQANLSLRGPSGKLDFDKIRMMFAAQNESQCGRVPPVEDGDNDNDDDHSHPSPPSVLPSRAHSSKQPVQRPSAGHRRSSTFGNQPWAAPIHENAANVVRRVLVVFGMRY